MRAPSPAVARFLAGVLTNFARPPAPVTGVDCALGPPTPQQMAGYVFDRSPTLLRGLLPHFALRDWSLDYLKGLDRGHAVSPEITVALNNVEQCASRLQRMAFRDFVSRLETIQRPLAEDIPRPPPEPDAPAPLEGEGDEEVPSLLARDQYLYFNEDRTLIDAHFPVLRRQLQDFRTALFPTGGYSAYSLWIGPRGSVTGLHADHDYNTLIQCQGSKTLLFIPADQEALVYPSGKFDPGASLSAVDLTKPKHNAARFPRLRDATPILAHLGPGDAVCIPRGCYHFVVCTEGPSMSCTLSLTPWHLKAREELQRVAHGAGLLGWSDAGCTCHDA